MVTVVTVVNHGPFMSPAASGICMHHVLMVSLTELGTQNQLFTGNIKRANSPLNADVL